MKNKNSLVKKKHYLLLILLTLVNIISVLLETIGISMIPALLISIVFPDTLELNNYIINYTRIIDFKGKNFILYFSIIILIFFVIKNLFFIFVKWFESITYKIINLHISENLFKGYLNLSYSKHQLNNPSILLRNITSESDNFTTYVISLINILREFLLVVFLFSLLFMQNKEMSIIIFLSLFLILTIFYLLMRKNVLHRGKLTQNLRGQQLKLVTESLGAIKFIKLLNKENEFTFKFKNNLKSILSQNVFLGLLQVIPKLFLELFAVICLLSATIYFINYSNNSSDLIPFLILLGIILVRLIPSFNNMSSALSLVKYHSVSYKLLLKEFSKFKKEGNQNNLKENNFNNKEVFKKEIVLNNLGYTYPSTNKAVLKNINIKIKPNTSIAIIGPSGSGKSTLIDLILGLLEPTNGKILIDNVSMKKKIKSWQSIIGYIPQDIYLEDDSIEKNISFEQDKNKIDSKHLKTIIKLCLLDNLIERLPKKEKTRIGNRGIRLSGGEIQRIGIARCLFRNPKVIIMDEATSSLDYQSEQEIIKSINNFKKNRTLITIAHRLSTIRNSDLIYILKEGKIVDSGKYNYLKKKHKDFFLNT